MQPKKKRPARTFTEVARRAQIVQCAADVLAEAGYARATMVQIARRAGIAKSVISYHFADKNELMQELIRTAVATFTQLIEPRLAAEPRACGKIRAYLAGSADYMTTHRNLHLAATANSPGNSGTLTSPSWPGCCALLSTTPWS